MHTVIVILNDGTVNTYSSKSRKEVWEWAMSDPMIRRTYLLKKWSTSPQDSVKIYVQFRECSFPFCEGCSEVKYDRYGDSVCTNSSQKDVYGCRCYDYYETYPES